MTSDYLDALDEMVADGLSALSPVFREKQIAFILSRQGADGGFSGRLGGSDLYYTDFALRGLLACGADHSFSQQAASFLFAQSAHTLIDYFNLLNCARMISFELDSDSLREWLLGQPPSSGSYDRFLYLLCAEMLGVSVALPPVECEFEQTNLTAAEIGVMILQGDFDAEKLVRGAEYLCSMQADDGGFRAHGGTREGDMLSTFTAMLTLSQLEGGLNGVDLKRVGEFLKAVADPEGGFHGCIADPESDTEYAYYGLGTLAILRDAVVAGAL